MAKLVFDIETSALPLETFDPAQREFLFREAEKIADPEERRLRQCELERMLSLWPLTARIICIAMVNPDTERGQVLYTADEHEETAPGDGGVQFHSFLDERELLAAFWAAAKRYHSIITFNGRGFDVPFIYLRSALLEVPIECRDWLGYRYAIEPHCDLADQLTFYGVSGREGASKRFNLDFYCKSFGIESPKSHGVTGMDIAKLLNNGQFRDIAEYCLRDVRATVKLYHVWRERLAGIK